jgi:hypothetical protein
MLVGLRCGANQQTPDRWLCGLTVLLCGAPAELPEVRRRNQLSMSAQHWRRVTVGRLNRHPAVRVIARRLSRPIGPPRSGPWSDEALAETLPGMDAEPILVAGISVLSTLSATAIGYWQWRRTQARSAREEYRTRRVTSLTELWEALNRLEKQYRSHGMLTDRFEETSDEIVQVNLLILRLAPFLQEDERQWAQDFVASLMEVVTMLRLDGDEGATETWWELTERQPGGSSKVAVAASRLGEAAESLAARYAAVTRGDHD